MKCGFGDAPGEAFGFAEFAVGEVVAFVPLQVAVVLPHLGYVALVLTATDVAHQFERHFVGFLLLFAQTHIDVFRLRRVGFVVFFPPRIHSEGEHAATASKMGVLVVVQRAKIPPSE